MPVYNERATCESAVKRVLDVTYPVEIELVIVDDGSTDGTVSSTPSGRTTRGWSCTRRPATRARDRRSARPSELADGRLRHHLRRRPRVRAGGDPGAAHTDAARRGRVVYGTRTFGSHNAYSYLYVLGNRAVTTFANVLFNCYISDLETCFKLLPLDLYRRLDVRSAGFGMEAELTGKLLRAGSGPTRSRSATRPAVARRARSSPGGTASTRSGSSAASGCVARRPPEPGSGGCRRCQPWRTLGRCLAAGPRHMNPRRGRTARPRGPGERRAVPRCARRNAAGLPRHARRPMFSGDARGPPDGRWTVSLHEHWFRVWQGKEAIRDLVSYVPLKSMLGTSDAFVAQGQIYIGAPRGRSRSRPPAWAGTQVLVFLVGAIGVAALSRRVLRWVAGQAALTVLVCSSYPFVVDLVHVQLIGMLACAWVVVGMHRPGPRPQHSAGSGPGAAWYRH